MSALEQEIIEKFRQLAPENRIQLLSKLEQEVSSPQLSLLDWLAEMKEARVTLRPDASGRVPTASELLNEVREERDADILRSLGFGDSGSDGAN